MRTFLNANRVSYLRNLATLRSVSTAAQQVEVDKSTDDGISILNLNRPPVNSLNLEFMQELIVAIDDAEKNSRGLILSSTNKSIFSAGLDLKEMHQPDVKRY